MTEKQVAKYLRDGELPITPGDSLLDGSEDFDLVTLVDHEAAVIDRGILEGNEVLRDRIRKNVWSLFMFDNRPEVAARLWSGQGQARRRNPKRLVRLLFNVVGGQEVIYLNGWKDLRRKSIRIVSEGEFQKMQKSGELVRLEERGRR